MLFGQILLRSAPITLLQNCWTGLYPHIHRLPPLRWESGCSPGKDIGHIIGGSHSGATTIAPVATERGCRPQFTTLQVIAFFNIGSGNGLLADTVSSHGPLTKYVKLPVSACAGNAGNVFPRHRLQIKPLVSGSGMHHGTCVTHVPWCMSGSLTHSGGENVQPAIPRIWQEAHC